MKGLDTYFKVNFNGMECLIHNATFKSFVRYLEHSNNMIQQIVVNLFILEQWIAINNMIQQIVVNLFTTVAMDRS